MDAISKKEAEAEDAKEKALEILKLKDKLTSLIRNLEHKPADDAEEKAKRLTVSLLALEILTLQDKLTSLIRNAGLVTLKELKVAAKPATKAGKKMRSGKEMMVTIAQNTGLTKKDVKAVFAAFNAIAYKKLKKTGKFVLAGLVTLKLNHKPATKAGNKMMFGKEMKVVAKPGKKVVKAYASDYMQYRVDDALHQQERLRRRLEGHDETAYWAMMHKMLDKK